MRFKLLLLSLILFAGLVAFAEATIIYVPEDYSTIPEAIDASIDGDTVMVGPGEYLDDIRFNGKGILLTSSHGPDSTMIGKVKMLDGEDSTSVLRGFLIRAEYSTAVEIRNVENPFIEANVVNGNYGLGGYATGMVISDRALIRNNIISDNMNIGTFAGLGGGIYAGNGRECYIENNIISGNRVVNAEGNIAAGGGLMISSGVICRFNLIANNEADDAYWNAGMAYGGGIDAGPNCAIINNTIVGNRAVILSGVYEGRGGGIHIFTDGDFVFKNNIVAFNEAGGGVWFTVEPDSGFWGYNCIYGNESFDYNEYYEPQHGDIFEDPLFVNMEDGDYHLQEDSRCIDAGDPNSPLDPDSTRADIGCYFYNHSTDVLDPEPSGPHKFHLRQNYPNPFNGQTIISYYLPDDAHVQLNIINMRGELVAKPIDAYQQKGEHTYTWLGTRSDGTPVATGIYFYELKVNAHRDVKAMVLLK